MTTQARTYRIDTEHIRRINDLSVTLEVNVSEVVDALLSAGFHGLDTGRLQLTTRPRRWSLGWEVKDDE